MAWVSKVIDINASSYSKMNIYFPKTIFIHSKFPSFQNLGACEDKDDWCMYGTPDCTNDNIKELCPKTCNICHGNDIFAIRAALILMVSDIELSLLHVFV